jgi:hypothetical protein
MTDKVQMELDRLGAAEKLLSDLDEHEMADDRLGDLILTWQALTRFVIKNVDDPENLAHQLMEIATL